MKLLFKNFQNSCDCSSVGWAPMAHSGRPDLAPQHLQKARLDSLHLCSPGWEGREAARSWGSLASPPSRIGEFQVSEKAKNGNERYWFWCFISYLFGIWGCPGRILKQAHNVMDFVVAFPCIHFFMQGSYFIACSYYWPKNPLGSV